MLNNNEKIIKEIQEDIKKIHSKVDLILEILDNFTLMIVDDEQSDQSEIDNYYSEWTPEQDENWNSYDDEEEN